MIKTQVYLHQNELDALRDVASRSGRSMADLIREAVRTIWLPTANQSPVGLWDGEMSHTSADHDCIYDDP